MATSFERLERLIARDHPGVAPKGRTIARVHSSRRERAVVLLHGMSASPASSSASPPIFTIAVITFSCRAFRITVTPIRSRPRSSGCGPTSFARRSTNT